MSKHKADFDDGATEVVHDRPMRRALDPIDIDEVSRAPSGGKVNRLAGLGLRHASEFILIRRQDQPAVHVPLPHLLVFKEIWNIWSARRALGEEESGVAVSDVQAVLDLPPTSVGSAMRNLLKNGAVRTVDSHIGWRSRRILYYPTEAGIEVFALAEHLGLGALVQVGKRARAWQDRSKNEPKNMFEHAYIINGGAVVASSPLENL